MQRFGRFLIFLPVRQDLSCRTRVDSVCKIYILLLKTAKNCVIPGIDALHRLTDRLHISLLNENGSYLIILPADCSPVRQPYFLRPETRAGLFVVIAGFSFATGTCLGGWLALKLGWLQIPPKILARSTDALIGAYLPLLAVLIFDRIEVGSPFFLISILASILGFYIPGWIKRN